MWFALSQSLLHEASYPQADTPNGQDFQFIDADGGSFAEVAQDATNCKLESVDASGLIDRQIDIAQPVTYRLTKTDITEPDRSASLIESRFEALSCGLSPVSVLFNPSLNNIGVGDALEARNGNLANAPMVSAGFAKHFSGCSGSSADGLVDLDGDRRLDSRSDFASIPGIVDQMARVNVGNDTMLTLAHGLGASPQEAICDAQTSLATPLASQQTKYAARWHTCFASPEPALNSVARQGMPTRYSAASMILWVFEDKNHPGRRCARAYRFGASSESFGIR